MKNVFEASAKLEQMKSLIPLQTKIKNVDHLTKKIKNRIDGALKNRANSPPSIINMLTTPSNIKVATKFLNIFLLVQETSISLFSAFSETGDTLSTDAIEISDSADAFPFDSIL